MISSLRKKLRTIRRSMLHWMLVSPGTTARVAWTFGCAGISCAALGLSCDTSAGAAAAADQPARINPARVTSARTNPVPLNSAQINPIPKRAKTAILRTAKKIVRAQDNPFEEDWEPDTDVSGRARVTPVSAEELAEVIQPGSDFADSDFERGNEIQQTGEEAMDELSASPAESELGAEATGVDATDSGALQRLKERSAKERWEKLHQEWLKNRKDRSRQLPPSRSPAIEAAPATGGSNDFEPQSEPALELPPSAGELATPSTEALDAGQEAAPTNPDAFETDRPIRAPRMESGRVRLQSQPKLRPDVKSDEELNKLFQGDDAEALAPPVRTPSELPKISEIAPMPKPRNTAPGRQIPEQDPKRYVKLGHMPYAGRVSPEFVYAWEATNFKHNPLYFEDAPLERYGHSLPEFLQPIASIGRFSGQLAFMPYQMTIHPLCSKVSPLGWYSPGDCVPYRLHQPPLNAKAAAVQTATVLGLSYGLP